MKSCCAMIRPVIVLLVALVVGCGRETPDPPPSDGPGGPELRDVPGTPPDVGLSKVPEALETQAPDGEWLIDRWRIDPELIGELGATVSYSDAERLGSNVFYIVAREFFIEVDTVRRDVPIMPVMRPYLSFRDEGSEVIAVVQDDRGRPETLRFVAKGEHALMQRGEETYPLRRLPTQ